MCGPMATLAMQAGSSILGGIGSNSAAKAQAKQLEYEAAGERDAATAQAERILKATRRERGAARAAIGASGAALDEFAMRNEQDIQEAGELDAAMAILTGKRRGRQLEGQAGMTRAAGKQAMFAGLVRAGGQLHNGWKGSKSAIAPINTPPFYDGTTGDFSQE